MSIAINYKNSSTSKNLANHILFINEKFNISTLKKHISSSEYVLISDLIKTKDPKEKILTFEINSKKKIILVSFKKNISNSEVENLGAKFYAKLKGYKQKEYNLNS